MGNCLNPPAGSTPAAGSDTQVPVVGSTATGSQQQTVPLEAQREAPSQHAVGPSLPCTAMHAVLLTQRQISRMAQSALEEALPALVCLDPMLCEEQHCAAVRRAAKGTGTPPTHTSNGPAGPPAAASPPFLHVVSVDRGDGGVEPAQQRQGPAGQHENAAVAQAAEWLRRLLAEESVRAAVAQAAREWRLGATFELAGVEGTTGVLQVTSQLWPEEEGGVPQAALTIVTTRGSSDHTQHKPAAEAGAKQQGVLEGERPASTHSRGGEASNASEQEAAVADAKHAEQELSQAERLLPGLSMLSSVPFAATLLEVDGGVTYQNQLSFRYFGDLTKPDDRQGPGCEELLSALLVGRVEAVVDVMDSVRRREPRRMVMQAPDSVASHFVRGATAGSGAAGPDSLPASAADAAVTAGGTSHSTTAAAVTAVTGILNHISEGPRIGGGFDGGGMPTRPLGTLPEDGRYRADGGGAHALPRGFSAPGPLEFSELTANECYRSSRHRPPEAPVTEQQQDGAGRLPTVPPTPCAPAPSLDQSLYNASLSSYSGDDVLAVQRSVKLRSLMMMTESTAGFHTLSRRTTPNHGENPLLQRLTNTEENDVNVSHTLAALAAILSGEGKIVPDSSGGSVALHLLGPVAAPAAGSSGVASTQDSRVQEQLQQQQQRAQEQQLPPPQQQQQDEAAAASDASDLELTWQEVHVLPVSDPGTGRDMLLLLQMDISERVEQEQRLHTISEAQADIMQLMFPRHILEHLLRMSASVPEPGIGSGIAGSGLATSHPEVTVLFCDICGFTTMSKEVPPSAVMAFLSSLFTLLDELNDQYEVYKVETAGDCYIVAGALMRIDEEGFLALDCESSAVVGAQRVFAFAKAVLRCAKTVSMPHNGQPTQVRIGLHTGPVVTGLIGTKLPKFSVFGDTMNTASRMESTCRHGCIQVSEATRALLDNHTFSPTGGVEVKGKGRMETYLWVPEEHPEEEYKSVREQAQEAAALLKHISHTLGSSSSRLSGANSSLQEQASLSDSSANQLAAAAASVGLGASLMALGPEMAMHMQAQLARPNLARGFTSTADIHSQQGTGSIFATHTGVARTPTGMGVTTADGRQGASAEARRPSAEARRPSAETHRTGVEARRASANGARRPSAAECASAAHLAQVAHLKGLLAGRSARSNLVTQHV